MVKQFTLGLCGLLKKSKLSLVSANFMMLQATSGSSQRSGAYLVELLYITDMRCCLSFIHSLYFPYIHIQVKYQGCGNCQSSCKDIC